MPKITIIVPIYKAEKYLNRCVNSILSQTFKDFELILVDDGSPDNCPMICDEYSVNDKRVMVIHKQNSGVSSARNCGIEVASGEYLMFIDSDDYIDSDMIEVMLNTTRVKTDYIIAGLSMETYKNGNIVRCDLYKMQNKEYNVRTLFEALESDYPLICISGPCCKIFKRKIIEENNIRFCEDMTLGEDTYFNLEYLEHCDSIIALSKEFYHYTRENDDSLFTKYNEQSFEIHEKVFDKMRDIIIKSECNDACRYNFEKMYFNLLVGCIHKDFQNLDKTDKTHRFNNIIRIINNRYIRRNISNFEFENVKSKVIHRLVYFGCVNFIYFMFRLYYQFYFIKKRYVT
jgi:glycosyltransferase involved in cell wall biosynthesis